MAESAARTYDESSARQRVDRELPGWRVADGELSRVYHTDGWRTTLMLINHIGYVAEAGFHHPELRVGWSSVDVRLSTHSAGGITDKDFELAARLEAVVLWRPSGGALEGPPGDWVRGGGGDG